MPNPKCLAIDCHKFSSFGYKKSSTVFLVKKKYFCSKHRLTDMVNLNNPYCRHNGCKKTATFNYSGNTRRLFCGDHKLSGMVNRKYIKTPFKKSKNNLNNFFKKLNIEDLLKITDKFIKLD